MSRLLQFALLWALGTVGARTQIIEFESNGLKYQTLTKGGLTVMFAPIPSNLKGYTVFQVAVQNGSPNVHTLDPEQFVFSSDELSATALPARQVVRRMLDRGNRDDVIKLVGAYEIGLYGLSRIQSTNGYEQRRQSAIAEFGGGKLKAAAAASAIAFVRTKLNPGDSTDGAIFFFPEGRELTRGKMTVRTGDLYFEFEPMTLRRP
ncbi:MAG: hypothetical protein NW208_06790 [Bryobacter sp.]|nr:hypothetical protein [Bryobacter sp.]